MSASTEDVYRDTNRFAVRVAKQMIQSERDRLKTLTRRLDHDYTEGKDDTAKARTTPSTKDRSNTARSEMDLSERVKGGGQPEKLEVDHGKWADSCYYYNQPRHWKQDCPKCKADAKKQRNEIKPTGLKV